MPKYEPKIIAETEQDISGFEETFQELHGRKILRLYVLEPDNTVREVFDIREWNARPRRLNIRPYVGASTTVRSSLIDKIRVFTMFDEIDDEYENDDSGGPFCTMFMARHPSASYEVENALRDSVEKEIGSRGYAKAKTWDEAMSQHQELAERVVEALKVIKARETKRRPSTATV